MVRGIRRAGDVGRQDEARARQPVELGERAADGDQHATEAFVAEHDHRDRHQTALLFDQDGDGVVEGLHPRHGLLVRIADHRDLSVAAEVMPRAGCHRIIDLNQHAFEAFIEVNAIVRRIKDAARFYTAARVVFDDR